MRAQDFADGLGLDIHLRIKHAISEVLWSQQPSGLVAMSCRLTPGDKFGITLDDAKEERVVVTTLKNMVSVSVQNATQANLGSSMGMMGSYPDGNSVERDGTTLMSDDMNAFGQEWQVGATGGQLFHPTSPYLGGSCIPPSAVDPPWKQDYLYGSC